jgi:hypothetical protein
MHEIKKANPGRAGLEPANLKMPRNHKSLYIQIQVVVRQGVINAKLNMAGRLTWFVGKYKGLR